MALPFKFLIAASTGYLFLILLLKAFGPAEQATEAVPAALSVHIPEADLGSEGTLEPLKEKVEATLAVPASAFESTIPEISPAPEPEPEIQIAKVVPASDTVIYDAVMANDAALIQKLISLGSPVQCTTAEGDTPLCAALRLKRDDLASLLIDHGADVNIPGLGGHTPLALACLRRRPEVVALLLEKGANPNKTLAHPLSPDLLEQLAPNVKKQLRSERNITPLMACAARGDVETVALLLKHGASTQRFTLPNRRYAINFAADERYLFIMRLLLGRDPDSEPQLLITVDLTKQQVWVEKEGRQVLRTSISSGRRGYETPHGRFVITNKYKDWTSTIYKVPMPYFLRLNCSAIGLHSGYVTGSPASHGCIRLPYSIAKKMYTLASVGDEVIIKR